MSRCDLCPGVNHCIPPDGPFGAPLLFVGEAPGATEQRTGRVFVGKTGEEVNGHYLPLAGLRRDAVGFTNAIRCLPPTAGGKLDPHRAKDLALLDSCARRFLYPHLERARPTVLIPLGAFACKAICPEIDLDLHHGIPVETRWGIPAFPMYHPALGIHEPKRMLHIRTDWQRLRRYCAGTLQLPQDPYPTPEYQEVTDAREIEALDPNQPIALDTESTRTHEPFCLTYSQAAGTGRLIRAARADILGTFQAALNRWRAPILFHHWLYDWPVTEAMGLQFPTHRIVDTMVRAYHLGNLPQGLKALAFRELGMTMQDWSDLVEPYSKALVLHYYRAAYAEAWPKPEEQTVRGANGKWELYRPQSMRTKLKRFFTDYQKAPETKDVFDMWTKNWVEEQGQMEAVCGEWPGRCITHVPFDQVITYACRDADSTLRLWPLLQRMSARVRHTSQEHWRGESR